MSETGRRRARGAAHFGPRIKLLIAALLLGTVPLIVASIILPRQVKATLTKTGNDHLAQVAGDLALLTQNEIQRNVETVRSLVSVDVIVAAFQRYNSATLDEAGLAATNRQLGRLMQQLDSRAQGMFICGGDGLIFAGVTKTGETGPYAKMDLRDRAYFVQARDSLKPVISDPIRSKIGNVPIVVIVVPVVDAQGKFAGLLGLSIEIEYLSDIISGQKLGQTGYPFAIDRHGVIFAHPDKTRLLNVNLGRIPGAERLAERMIRGETGVEAYISSKGAHKLAAFAPVPICGWSVAASMEIAEFAAPAQHLRWIIFAMICACVVVAILVAVTFAMGLERLKQALAEARHNEAELAVIHNNAPTMMVLLDRDCRIRRANRAAHLFAARHDDRAEGLADGEFFGCIHARDDLRGCGFGPDCAACKLQQAERDTAATGTSHSQLETRLRLVRGTATVEHVLQASTARIEIDGDRMVLLCLEDVTEQRQAEERIREQAALLDVTRDAIYVLDLDGGIVFWNRGAESIYGWTAKEAIGRKLAELLSDSSYAHVYAEANEAVWSQGEWAGELHLKTRAGQVRIMQCRITLIRGPAGDPRSILAVNTDVTEARKVEAQFLRAQRLDSLGELASGVAHDLNNVLSPILMAVELLRPCAVDRDSRETLRVLGDSAKRGADVVRQLLLFGRGSDGPRANVNVAVVLAELQRMIKGSFPKDIAVDHDIAGDLRQVLADRTQLYQVFLNLAVNARDAMPEGGCLTLAAGNVEIDAAVAKKQPGAKIGRHIVVKVTDTGVGIPPNIMEKIFDPFFTTKGEGRGTGLGLSTVLGIVRSHGGFVTVQSQLGAGTEFAVYLPAIGQAGVETAIGTNAAPVRGNGELVLVVDDENPIRDILRRNLESANYRVLLARDGTEALQLFAEHRSEIQAVVTDLVMPGMDGIQTIAGLRKLDTGVPIIALSGADSWRVKLQQSGEPRVGFLAKPFPSPTLLAALQRALEERRRSAPTMAEAEFPRRG